MRTVPGSVRILGAACSLVALVASLLDIVLSMLPGWGPETVPTASADWFVQLASQPMLGLRNLDLLNAVMSLVMVPMFVALAWHLVRRSPALVSTGLAFALLGAALFVANNVALPMYGLSARYGAGVTTAETASMLAAGEALLSQGQHGSFGAAPGFIVSELGTLLLALGMWRMTRMRWLAIAGSTGSILLGAYTVWNLAGAAPLGLAAVGGIAMMVWLAGVAAVLLRRDNSAQEYVAA